MGTVPDPLRSARLSLIAAAEEENGLREPHSPKRPCKQASVERNGNGFPLPAKAQPAGDHLPDMSCATVEEKRRDERCCGHGTDQASLLTAGSLSPSKEGPPAMPEPASNSEQEGSKESRGLAAVEDPGPVQLAVKGLPTQEANEATQSSDRGQCCKATEQANSTPGDGVKGSEAHGCISSCLQSSAPQASAAVGEKSGPERAQLSAKEPEAISDLEGKAPICRDAELPERKDAQPADRKNAEVVPEAECQLSLERAPQPSPKTETGEEVAAELSKFKDTGTMTVHMDSGPVVTEAVHKDHQDAGVQAVANMENKSSSTSPSIFAAFLRENAHPETKLKQEQLQDIYAGSGGKEPQEMADGYAPLLQTAPPTGIVPEMHVQAAAAIDTLGTQAGRVQSAPVGVHDTVCSASSDSGKHPCSLTSASAQGTPVDRVEAQKAGLAGGHVDAQQPSGSSASSKTRPVYQITVSSSNQQPAKVKTKLPPSAAPAPGPCIAGNSQASPSLHREPEQAACIARDSKRPQHLQIQTVSGLETGPAGSPVDVKPKREEKFIPLHSKELEGSKMGAAARPQAGCSPGPGKREQQKVPEQSKEVILPGSQRLGAGPDVESRRSPAPARGLQVAKGSDLRKEAKTASPAQHRLNFSGNKKESRPGTEAKVQAKQSKRVRDVVWDEQGMTWEVYGASLDPESLGIAIQNHLQRQIREHEKLIKSQSAQNRKSISSDTSSSRKLKGRQHGVFQSMLQNIRRPNCCVRPTASSVLD